MTFCRTTTESVLQDTVTVTIWFAACSAADRTPQQKVTRTLEKVTGSLLSAVLFLLPPPGGAAVRLIESSVWSPCRTRKRRSLIGCRT